MKKKTTFRMMFIVGAFALLTLPTVFNAGSAVAVAAPAPAPAPAYGCLSEFLDCMANTGGDPDCLTQFLECLG